MFASPTRIISLAILIFLGAFLLQIAFDRYAQRNFFSIIERIYFDFKINNRTVNFKKNNVAIIGIGEATIAELGRFPFSRKNYAKLLNKLQSIGVKVAAFDLLFSEPEWVGEGIDTDQLLAEAVPGNMPIIFGYRYNIFTDDGVILPTNAFQNLSEERKEEIRQRKELLKDRNLPVQLQAQMSRRKIVHSIYSASEPILPITKLFRKVNFQHNPVSFGFFNVTHDADGILRRTPLLTYYNGQIFSSLALEAANYFLEPEKRARPILSDYGFENLIVLSADGSQKSIPIDPRGRLWVNYHGNEGTIPTYEMIDVLKGRVGKKELNGKLLFIGTTEGTLGDNKATPMEASFPGVEINATIANSIIEQNFIIQDWRYFWIGLFMLTVGALIFSQIVLWLNPTISFLLCMAIEYALIYIDQKVFFDNGILTPALWPAMQYFSIFAGIFVYRFISTENEKKFIQTAFSRFVSSSVAEEIMRDHDKLKIGGTKCELTVLFTDIEGFTEIAEKIDAKILSEYLNNFFTVLTNVILKNRGTLDKYIGDSIMCFWGAPLVEAKHAELACKTALEMQEAVKEIDSIWYPKIGFKTRIRIGINSGEMSVGNMGSEQIFDYTVIGDNVNLASRLEGVNKSYHTKILVGTSTYLQCSDQFLFRALDRIQVRGRDESVEIFELLCTKENAENETEWVETFARGRAAYAKQQWNESMQAFQLCLQMRPEDKVAEIYLQRIQAETEGSGLIELKQKRFKKN